MGQCASIGAHDAGRLAYLLVSISDTSISNESVLEWQLDLKTDCGLDPQWLAVRRRARTPKHLERLKNKSEADLRHSGNVFVQSLVHRE